MKMAPGQCEEKPQPGDLIEIYRLIYQHWGIYVGDGYIIHLAPPSEDAHPGASSMMFVLSDKAFVKKEELSFVVGDDEYKVNNLLDYKYEPRPAHAIVHEAYSLLGRELPYSVISSNCEHFVTDLRYGKAESRQVRKAVEMVAGAGFEVVAFVADLFGSGNKEKKNTQ
ncbi:phospholipase A and acyltransferase 3-like [Tachysurus fulvidraco]|uniref:phospholipase A and acyltransferase 3-like n=1 Tax=Tachysurus fulvidraco TaxID=1234273 RepID=UPI001FED375F|nr:phospholipase A and acyltransferase 3-like [Tachysurus fulvidraco]